MFNNWILELPIIVYHSHFILESSDCNISDGLTSEEENSFARPVLLLLSTDMLDIAQFCFRSIATSILISLFSYKMAVLSGKEH